MSKRRWGFQWRGAIGLGILLPAVVAGLLSPPSFPEDSWADVGADAVGFGFFILGAALRFWSTLYLGARKGREVVQEGPYSVCRNPIYLGSLCLALSVGVFLKSAVACVGVVLSAAAYVVLTIPGEEAKLREELGEEYARYCERVPRLWPRFSAYRAAETLEVHIRGLALERRRAVRWIWVPALFRILSHCRAQEWWPHPFPFV